MLTEDPLNPGFFLDPGGEFIEDPDNPGFFLPTGYTRTFDLGLRSREVDHEAKTVTLRLASDEAVLQKYAELVDDPTPRTYESSLRDVCDYVLGKIGAELEPGDSDADVTAYWEVKNLIINPNARVNVTGWDASFSGTGSGTVTRETTTAFTEGGQSPGSRLVLTMTSTANATASLRYGISAANNIKGIEGGQRYWLTTWISHNAGVDKIGRAAIVWKDDQSNTIRTDIDSGITTVPTNQFTRIATSAVAPAGATAASIVVGVADGLPSGAILTANGTMLCESDYDPGVWFDGGRTDDLGYSYEYEGDTGASASVRTPDAERRPESLTLEAGQWAWDFLMVLCASVGMVLWCDEERRWHLSTPEARTVPQLLSVVARNSRQGTDTLDRDDEESFITGVVIRYAWTDAAGIAREAIDAAGDPGKVVVRELRNTPYPGPGIAAALLARHTGTGRQQSATAITRWVATPGMTANVTLPGAPETAGRVAGVTFHTDGFMDLELAGLLDVIPGSWLATDPSEAWTDPPASTWADWT